REGARRRGRDRAGANRAVLGHARLRRARPVGEPGPDRPAACRRVVTSRRGRRPHRAAADRERRRGAAGLCGNRIAPVVTGTAGAIRWLRRAGRLVSNSGALPLSYAPAVAGTAGVEPATTRSHFELAGSRPRASTGVTIPIRRGSGQRDSRA